MPTCFTLCSWSYLIFFSSNCRYILACSSHFFTAMFSFMQGLTIEAGLMHWMLGWVLPGIPPKSEAWLWARFLTVSMRFMKWTIIWHAPPFSHALSCRRRCCRTADWVCEMRLMLHCGLVGLMDSMLLNWRWIVIRLPGFLLLCF